MSGSHLDDHSDVFIKPENCLGAGLACVMLLILDRSKYDAYGPLKNVKIANVARGSLLPHIKSLLVTLRAQGRGDLSLSLRSWPSVRSQLFWSLHSSPGPDSVLGGIRPAFPVPGPVLRPASTNRSLSPAKTQRFSQIRAVLLRREDWSCKPSSGARTPGMRRRGNSCPKKAGQSTYVLSYYADVYLVSKTVPRVSGQIIVMDLLSSTVISRVSTTPSLRQLCYQTT